jgi:hypothetical protein
MLTRVDFSAGQHDTVDFYEALMRTFNVGGVFCTQKTVNTVYTNGKTTKQTSLDQMFRYSVHHALLAGRTKFETLFPSVDTLEVSFAYPDTNVKNDQEDVLKEQRTTVEFVGGPVLCLTREIHHSTVPPVVYGRVKPSSAAVLLPVLNTVKKLVQWYELQAVVCWKGVMTRFGELGHYVAFVYNQNMWWFYNDLDHVDNGTTRLQSVPGGLESHPEYLPSLTGVLFIYAIVSNEGMVLK